MSPPAEEATRMLHAAASGDAGESARLLELLYGELHAVARGYMGGQAEHTLQPTALVHEAWMKLFGNDMAAYKDRGHFLTTAARAMRQILVDHARRRKSDKRGGAWNKVELAVDPAVEWTGSLDIEELDAALEKLEREFPRQARIVELRYFGDLSEEQTAEVLELSSRTVRREWRFAKAWLSRELGDESETD